MYQESATVVENMVVQTQGPAIRRGGFRYITSAGEPNAASGHRLIPFRINASKGVLVHVGPDMVSLYDDNGPVIGGVGATVNQNPNFTDQLTGWAERNYVFDGASGSLTYGTPYADVAWSSVIPSAHYTSRHVGSIDDATRAALAQAVTLQPNTQYTLAFTSQPDAVPIAGNFTPLGFVRVVEVVTPNDFFPANANYVTNTLATVPFGLEFPTGTVTFTTPAWPTARIVHLEADLSDQSNLSGSPVSGAFLLECRLSAFSGAPVAVTFPSPWIGKDIKLLSYARMPTAAGQLQFAHKDVGSHVLTYDDVLSSWGLSAVVFVGQPWATTDHPGTVGFFQGRMVLASSNNNPERLWFSKVFDYINFTPGSNASDSFSGDLSEPGRVVWVKAMNTLIIGAESGIWDMGAVSGVAIGPGNAQVFRHSAHYAFGPAPVFSNNQTAYIAQGGQRLFAIRREGDTNRYEETELSFTGRHLTSSGLKDLAWAEVPNSVMFANTSNTGLGSLVGATHDPKIIQGAGWHRHDVGGTVEAIASLNQGGIDYVYALVARSKAVATATAFSSGFSSGFGGPDAGSVTYLSFEKMDWARYLDAFVSRGNSPASNVITGLDHLTGLDVWAVSNEGVVYGPKKVTAAGTITIEDAVSSAVVGLEFRSRLITKRPEGISQSGTTQGTKQRWNKIFVRVAPGSRPLINGKRPAERSVVTPMNEGEPVAFEDVEVSNLGWDNAGRVTIEEDLPKPLVVVAVFGQVTSEVL